MFDRFVRADKSRSREVGSTGLGLSIVAAIVHAHHGTVVVNSTSEGTAFCVRFPTIPAPADSA